jgi:hypothetical protein
MLSSFGANAQVAADAAEIATSLNKTVEKA